MGGRKPSVVSSAITSLVTQSRWHICRINTNSEAEAPSCHRGISTYSKKQHNKEGKQPNRRLVFTENTNNPTQPSISRIFQLQFGEYHLVFLCKTPRCSPSPPPLSSSSSSVYLSLKEEDDGKEVESGPDEVLMAESYMTMAQSENCRLVDASIQKNISFDGKPLTPTGWSGGMSEVFSLREQLQQAEEKASQVQREVRATAPPAIT